MLLKEFFSVPLNIDQNQKKRDEHNVNFEDDLFWFILDHDKIHKDYFFPISKKLKKLKECSESQIYELFMPMVEKGCKEFYADKKMNGKLGKLFPLDMREGICKKLYEHYQEGENEKNDKVEKHVS